MSDSDLFDAVALKTGEDSHEIRCRGFVPTGSEDSGPEPECLLDVLLVDLDELGTSRLGRARLRLPGAVLRPRHEGPEEGQEAGGPSGVTC